MDYLLEKLAALLGATLIAAGTTALGDMVLRRLAGRAYRGLLRTVLAFALGMGLTSHLLLVLGLLGLYRPLVGWLLLSALTSLAIFHYAPQLSTLPPWRHMLTWVWQDLSPGQRLATGALLWLMLLGLAGGLLPPHSLDTLKYHFAAPRWYVSQGNIDFLPFLYFQLPAAGEMLYAWSLLLGNDLLGTLINASFGPATTLALYAGARAYLPRTTALLGTILLCTVPGMWDYAYASMPDLGLFLYTVLALILYRRWTQTWSWSDLALAGLCAGFAAAFKIIGLYVVFGLGLLVLWALLQRKGTPRRGRSLLHFAAAVIAAGMPWYLRNWLETGNPVWPIFYPWLGGRCWNLPAYELGYQAIRQAFSPLGFTPVDWLIGPLRLLVGDAGGPLFSPPGIGPLFLAFLPIALLWPTVRRRQGWILAFAGLYYLAWFPFSQYGRFFLPAYLLLCLPVADAAIELRRLGQTARLLTTAILALWVLFSAGWLSGRSAWFAPAILGLENRDQFLSRSTPIYPDLQWLNQELPEEAIVLSDDLYLYYLERRYVWNVGGLQGFLDYSQIHDGEDLRDALGTLGITHALVLDCADCPWDPFTQMYRAMLEAYGTPIYNNPQSTYPVRLVRNVTGTVEVTVYELDLEGHERSGAVCEVF